MLCPSCQAHNSPSAGWCGRCFAPLLERGDAHGASSASVPWPPPPSSPLLPPPQWLPAPPRRRSSVWALALVVFLVAQAVIGATIYSVSKPRARHAVVIPAGDPRDAVELVRASVVQV